MEGKLMRVLIVNTVCLNGGDFAILQSEIELLKRQFGESVEIAACDDYAKESQTYHPGVRFIDPVILKASVFSGTSQLRTHLQSRSYQDRRNADG